MRKTAVAIGVRNAWCLVLGCLLACTGCGKPENKFDQSTETGALNVLLVDVQDATTNQGLAERIWEKGKVPAAAERAKFGKYSFSAVEHKIEGASATVKVEIKDNTGNIVATKDWTASKADGSWKLVSTPLP